MASTESGPRRDAPAARLASPAVRLASLDVLRGFDMFWITAAATAIRWLLFYDRYRKKTFLRV